MAEPDVELGVVDAAAAPAAVFSSSAVSASADGAASDPSGSSKHPGRAGGERIRLARRSGAAHVPQFLVGRVGAAFALRSQPPLRPQ